MIVTLDYPQMYRAAQVGARRLIVALKGNCRNKYGGEKRDPWATNIGGAMGESAAAIALDVEWPATFHVQAKDEPDLPPDWQVRTSLHAGATSRLVITDDDLDEHRFVLVIACRYPQPVFDVRGWIFAGDARRSEWRHDYSNGPLYFVPPAEAMRLGLWHGLEDRQHEQHGRSTHRLFASV